MYLPSRSSALSLYARALRFFAPTLGLLVLGLGLSSRTLAGGDGLRPVLAETTPADRLAVRPDADGQPLRVTARLDRAALARQQAAASALPDETQRRDLVRETLSRLVPTLTATMVDFPDPADDNIAEPGEVIRYEVTLTNTSTSEDATSVVFNAATPTNTTFNAGSVTVTPIAFDDAYAVLGNVGLNVPAGSGLLVNDTDPDGTGTLVVNTASVTRDASSTVTGNGTLSVSADGSFTYTPPVGETGTEVFTYTVNDDSGTGLDCVTPGVVVFTISDVIWFIDNADGGANAGTLSDPFQSIAAFNASGLPGANDNIYLAETGTNYTTGIVLQSGQTLIGEGATDTSLENVLGLTVPPNSNALPAINGTRPVIAPAAGDGLTLGGTNTIQGLNVENGAGRGIFGNAVGGTTNVSEVALNNNAGVEIELTGATGAFNFDAGSVICAATDAIHIGGGSVAVTFTETPVTHAGSNAILINGGHSGSFAYEDDGTNQIMQTGGVGVNIDGSSGTYTIDNVSVTTGATGLSVTNSASATTTFRDVSIDAATGVNLTTAGTVTFSTVDGTNTVAATAGPGVNATTTTIGAGGWTFSTLSSTSTTTDGINLDNVGGGSFTASGGTITNSGAHVAVDLNALSAGFSYAGTIDNNAGGRSVEVTNSGSAAGGGNTITFSGAIDDDGTGVFLDNNDQNTNGATVILTGGLALDTGASVAFTATNGGTVNVTGTNTIGVTTALSATAVNIANTTIGASGVTFESVSVNGAPNGIVLDNTGTSGGFTVTGDGSTTGGVLDRDGSGGTIQSTTDDGVSLNAAHDVTLRQMNIWSAGNSANSGNTTLASNDHAVESRGGSDIVLSAVHIRDPIGTGWEAFDITGTSRLDHGSLVEELDRTSNFPGVRVRNTSTSFTAFTIDGSTFDHKDPTPGDAATNGNAMVVLSMLGNSGGAWTVTNSTFTGARGQAMTIGVGDSAGSSGTVTTTVSGNLFHTSHPINGQNNLGITALEGTNHTVTVTNNTFLDVGRGNSNSGQIIVQKDDTATLDASISGNTIHTVTAQRGIEVLSLNTASGGKVDAEIFDNNVYGVGREGVFISARGGEPDMDVRVFDNCLGRVETVGGCDGAIEALGAQNSGPGILIDAQANAKLDVKVDGNVVYARPATFGSCGGSNCGVLTINVENFPTGTAVVNATVEDNILNNDIAGGTNFLARARDCGLTLNVDLGGGATTGTAGDGLPNTAQGSTTAYDILDDSFGCAPGTAPTVAVENLANVDNDNLPVGNVNTTGTVAFGGNVNEPNFSMAPINLGYNAHPASEPVGLSPRGGIADRHTARSRIVESRSLAPVLTLGLAQPDLRWRGDGEALIQHEAISSQPTVMTSLPLAAKAVMKVSGVAEAQEAVIHDRSLGSFAPDLETAPFVATASTEVFEIAHMLYQPNTSISSLPTGPPSARREPTSLALGTLPAGKAVEVTYTVTIDDPLAAGVTSITGQGTVTADGGVNLLTDDPDDATGNDDPTVTTLVNADLELTGKTDSPDPVSVGGQITYTIDLVNGGPDAAETVTVTDTTPTGTTFVSASVTSGTGWTPTTPSVGSTGDVVFSKATVANAETATFEVVVSVDAGVTPGTSIDNTATAASATLDGDLSNNTAMASTTTQAVDLALSKTDGDVTVNPGDDVVYTLTYLNNGNQAASGVEITETVPLHTTFNDGASTAGWSCADGAPGGTSCTFTVGAVAGSGGTGTVDFAVTVNDPFVANVAEVMNEASIADDGAETATGDNTAGDTTPVTNPLAVVINEVDYDQGAVDAAEFIELKNTGTAALDLSDYQLKLVRQEAGGPVVYKTIPLTGTLGVGDYFVLCANAAFFSAGACDLDTTPDTDLIEDADGATVTGTAVRLEHTATATRVDAVAFEGAVDDNTETAPAGADDTTPANAGLSRDPDGADTDDNSADFALRCVTPGALNTSDTNTTACASPTPVAVAPVFLLQGAVVSAEAAAKQGEDPLAAAAEAAAAKGDLSAFDFSQPVSLFYPAGPMRTDLIDDANNFDGPANEQFPTTQPYGDPAYDGTLLDHNGTESVSSADTAPANGIPDFFETAPGNRVVDWVLVKLVTYDAIGEEITVESVRAVLLLDDGTVYDPVTETVGAVSFNAPGGTYRVVVCHRNHLGVMSSSDVVLVPGAMATAYDYTTAQSQGHDKPGDSDPTPMVEVSGAYALVAGDGRKDVNEAVSTGDFFAWVLQLGSNVGVYFGGDYNLNGDIATSDFVVWLSNLGELSQVPPGAP